MRTVSELPAHHVLVEHCVLGGARPSRLPGGCERAAVVTVLTTREEKLG